MISQYDVAVVGLGAMGSATLHELARRGIRAIGFDRHTPPHSLGSSHGRSRIIREAYFEDPAYVPLVQRAYERWAEIEADSGLSVFTQTGGLMLGAPNGNLVAGARLSAKLHELPFEEIDAREVRLRFPALKPEAGTVAIFEPRAGALNPERAIEAMLTLARGRGAEVRTGVAVEGWTTTESTVRLNTSDGAVEVGHAVIAAGPWLNQLIGQTVPLDIERQLMLWFSPAEPTDLLGPDRLPVFIWEWEPERYFYGIPDLGDGFKFARHHEGAITTPNAVDREVGTAEIEDAASCLRKYLPVAAGAFQSAAVCLYSNTPDQHFVIGPHPAEPRITLLSPCSGHGFKFASAIGEIGADLATTGQSRFDLSLFSPQRFWKS